MVNTAVVGSVALVGLGLLVYLWNKWKTPKSPLSPQQYTKFPLIKKEDISADTMLFRFGLPDKNQTLGLPIGSHISLRASESVVRSYTPVSTSQVKGHFDLVVKIYPPTPEVPPSDALPNGRPAFSGGKMGTYLKDLPVGQCVEMRGPVGDLEYLGRGQFAIKRREGAGPKVRKVVTASRVGMIAGGTGLTPMLQIINESLLDPADTTQFYLLFANKTEADILYHSELLALQEKHSRVHVFFTLDTPPGPQWTGFSGFVTEQMLSKCMPFPKGNDVPLILMCGPPPMMNMLTKQLSTASEAIPQPFAATQFYAF